jgi:hypothetical protein
VNVQLYAFLNSKLVAEDLSALIPGRFTPEEEPLVFIKWKAGREQDPGFVV